MKNGKKDQNIDEIIGCNVGMFRKINGIERKILAEACHISDDALYRLEKGETGLSGEYAYILANEFDCDMNYIYGKIDSSELVFKSMERAMNNSNKDNIKQMASRMLRYAAQILEDLDESEEK